MLRCIPISRARTPPRPRNWGYDMRNALTVLEYTIGSALLIGLIAYSMQGVAMIVGLIM